jgi:hypothetical protein
VACPVAKRRAGNATAAMFRRHSAITAHKPDLPSCPWGLKRYHLSYARLSELSSNHRTDLNVGGAPRRLSPCKIKAHETRIECRLRELIGKPNKNAPSAYAISFTLLCI